MIRAQQAPSVNSPQQGVFGLSMTAFASSLLIALPGAPVQPQSPGADGADASPGLFQGLLAGFVGEADAGTGQDVADPTTSTANSITMPPGMMFMPPFRFADQVANVGQVDGQVDADASLLPAAPSSGLIGLELTGPALTGPALGGEPPAAEGGPSIPRGGDGRLANPDVPAVDRSMATALAGTPAFAPETPARAVPAADGAMAKAAVAAPAFTAEPVQDASAAADQPLTRATAAAPAMVSQTAPPAPHAAGRPTERAAALPVLASEAAPAAEPPAASPAIAADAAPRVAPAADRPMAKTAVASPADPSRPAPLTQLAANQPPVVRSDAAAPPAQPSGPVAPATATAPAAPGLATPASTATGAAPPSPSAPRSTPTAGEPRAVASQGSKDRAATPNAAATGRQPSAATGAAGSDPLARMTADPEASSDLAPLEAEIVDVAGPAPQTIPPDTRPVLAPGETLASAAADATTPRALPETVARLAADILHKLGGQSTRFELELDPAGLGRVDVSVEIAADGRLRATMAFDSPQAAADLRGRAGELRQMLEQAGFDLSEGALSFDLAGQGGGWTGREAADQDRAWSGRAFRALQQGLDDADAALAASLSDYSRPPAGGVDIRI